MRKSWMTLILLLLATFVLAACSGNTPATTQPAQAQVTTAGMEHDSDPMSDNSYDVHFIDSTLEHHAGVMSMAEQALKESQTVELKDLAQKTMTVTQQEIDWLNAYRQKNHPDAPEMNDEMDMGAMGISSDASKSFDQRYAEAMISHHQGSIEMAKEALAKVGHEELKQFAQNMLSIEEGEVSQLQKFIN